MVIRRTQDFVLATHCENNIRQNIRQFTDLHNKKRATEGVEQVPGEDVLQLEETVTKKEAPEDPEQLSE